jgi:hypothetical protein
VRPAHGLFSHSEVDEPTNRDEQPERPQISRMDLFREPATPNNPAPAED